MNPSTGSLDIIIPVRNGGEPLKRTLTALTASEDQGFRVLISDNYSTDGTPWKQALDTFRPGQVVQLQPPEPLGRVEHWSWAAGHAEAAYCKLLLCGDRFPSDHIGKIRRAFALQADLIYTQFATLQPGGTLEEALKNITLREVLTPLTTADYLKRSETEFNLIGPLSGVTFRTSALQKALPFDSSHPWTADWRLFSRMMQNGDAIHCEATYCVQDRSIARLSSSFRGVLNGIFEERDYQRELSGKPPVGPVTRYLRAWRPVAGLAARHVLPLALLRPLAALARVISGRKT